jgi:hypothetical protein
MINHRPNKTLLLPFLLPMAFDFKGEISGGSIVIYALYVCSIIGGLIAVWTHLVEKGIKSLSKGSGYLIAWCVLAGCASAFKVPETNQVLSVWSPLLLFVLGFGIAKVALELMNPEDIIHSAWLCCVISVIVTGIFGYITAGTSILDIRYQILSPAIFVLTPILVARSLFAGKISLSNSAQLLAVAIILVISSTRSWLIAYFGVFAVGLIFLAWATDGGLLKLVAMTGAVALLLSAGVFLLDLFLPETLDRLYERVVLGSENGFDVTSYTRLSEVDYQIDAWSTDWWTALSGLGLGSNYGLSGYWADALLPILGMEETSGAWFYAGHNFWVYSIYSLGLALGLFLPTLLLRSAFMSISLLSVAKKLSCFANNSSSTVLLALLALVPISALLSTIGGNFIGSRIQCALFGLMLGLLSEQLRILKSQISDSDRRSLSPFTVNA